MHTFRGCRVLVTGGAGFIGSHLVEALVGQGALVTVVDDFSSGRHENLEGVADAVGVIEGDLCHDAILERALEGIEVVLHLATRCVRLSLSEPDEVYRVNSTATYQLLMRSVHHRVRRFVYVSSSEVYGSAREVPMREDHPLDPTTLYGATKLAGEFYAQAVARSFGLETVIVRPFNTYGPRAHFEGVYGEVIPRFTVNLLNGRRPLIFGDGLQTRDFTYVSDTVLGIHLAAATDRAVGQVVNIARGEEVSVRRLAELLGKLINPFVDPEYTPARPADVRRHLADVRLAQNILGFRAELGIEEGLRRYVEWFLQAYPDPSVCLPDIAAHNW